MSRYKLSRAEMETIIRWDDEEKIAHINTASPITMRKLEKLMQAYPETYKLAASTEYDMTVEVNAKLIRFGRPPTQEMIERGRRLHSKLTNS